MLTYGDGLSNVNLKKLLKFHKKNNHYVTLTAVRPPARFGGIKISGKRVKYFKEKSKLDEGWINGGFFVMEPKIFHYIKDNKTILEQYPLEKLSKIKKLGAFKHNGYWQCVDTIRDKELLELAIKNKRLNEREDFSYRRNRIYWFTCIEKFVKKNLFFFPYRKKKTNLKKIKNVKYIFKDITKINLLKKINENFDHIINLCGYVDHSDKKK